MLTTWWLLIKPIASITAEMVTYAVYNGPSAGEHRDDVIIGCSTPTNQSARTCSDLASLETLFVNIQGLLNMAVERSRDREEQINYEKGLFRILPTPVKITLFL